MSKWFQIKTALSWDVSLTQLLISLRFVEFLPSKEGLLHISEISHARIEKMEDAGFSKGDKVQVKLVGIDNKGRFNGHRKQKQC